MLFFIVMGFFLDGISIVVLTTSVILPMVLAAVNVGWFWPKRSLLRHPGTAVVEFLETLPAGLTRDEVSRRMEAGIEAGSDRLGEEAAQQLGAARDQRA